MNSLTRVLVTGSNGQVGMHLLPMLYQKHGVENVVASDIFEPKTPLKGKFEKLDVTDFKNYEKLVKDNKITQIIHFGAILSATGELKPHLALEVNMRGLEHTLELGRQNKCQVFFPSSIAAFGEKIPKKDVHEDVVLLPNTIYGVSKVYAELLGRYYYKKFGVDFRSLRYPGVISSYAFESHGTIGFATEIFVGALTQKKYECYLQPETKLPMIHIDDCCRATLDLIEAKDSVLTRRAYNLAGLSFCNRDLELEILKKIPDFVCTYKPDFRDDIAQSWPDSLSNEDNKDWGWNFKMTVPELCEKMLREVKMNLDKPNI